MDNVAKTGQIPNMSFIEVVRSVQLIFEIFPGSRGRDHQQLCIACYGIYQNNR